MLWVLAAFAVSSACGADENDDAPLPPADGGLSPVDASGADGRAAPDATAQPVDASVPPPDAGAPVGSAGCGLAPSHTLGGTHVTQLFSPAAGMDRGYFLVVPAGYDPDVPHRLIFGFAGTNSVGEPYRDYVDAEDPAEHELYVYPDLQWHDFPFWGNLGGWLLGPHAYPADGMEDLQFVRELVAHMSVTYCVHPDRVFAHGHSWGGDMAAVVACFLGDVFRATAPAAANRPYWFEPSSGEVGCVDSAAVWTFFGQNDTHFTTQSYPGEYGDEQVAFWKAKHDCATTELDLGIGAPNECVEYSGCSEVTRYCFYDPATGHLVPSYYADAVMSWFRSFE